MCNLDELVDIAADFVDMVGKVRGVGEQIFFFGRSVQNQSSKKRTYHTPFGDIQVIGFADQSQSIIFRIVETEHYVMVPFHFPQSFSASFALSHFRSFFVKTLRQK